MPNDMNQQFLNFFKKGMAESFTITFNKFPNAAEVRNWMSELKVKCVVGSNNDTQVVVWLNQVENQNNLAQDFSLLGRLYDKKYATLEIKSMKGLEKILTGDFKRKIDHLKEEFLSKQPVNVVTGRMVVKMILDKNKVTRHDWHLSDLERIKTIELQHDNVAKFV